MEFLVRKEKREARGIKDLRDLWDQWDPKGALGNPDFGAKKENREFLESQGQWGKLDREENREIMASQATVRWDEKEQRAHEDSLEMWDRRVMLAILEYLGVPDPKDSGD